MGGAKETLAKIAAVEHSKQVDGLDNGTATEYVEALRRTRLVEIDKVKNSRGKWQDIVFLATKESLVTKNKNGTSRAGTWSGFSLEALMELVKESGHTREAVAERVGVSTSGLHRWVAGETVPRPERQKALAKAYSDWKTGDWVTKRTRSTSKDATTKKRRRNRSWGVFSHEKLQELLDHSGIAKSAIASATGISSSSLRVWSIKMAIPSDQHQERLAQLYDSWKKGNLTLPVFECVGCKRSVSSIVAKDLCAGCYSRAAKNSKRAKLGLPPIKRKVMLEPELDCGTATEPKSDPSTRDSTPLDLEVSAIMSCDRILSVLDAGACRRVISWLEMKHGGHLLR
jgi:transcriptional regulator with XRE-family HTH domain